MHVIGTEQCVVLAVEGVVLVLQHAREVLDNGVPAHAFRVEAFRRCLRQEPFCRELVGPLNALTRRFYFVYQRESHDVGKASKLHAALLRAIASGDETAAAEAADHVVDYAEFYTRSVIVGRSKVGR